MRDSNWQLRLAEFGRARASMPFRWGSNDCCSFAAAAVEAITAIDLMASVEPYATELGALRRITEAGGLKALASQYLGEAVSPLMAGVGDVVLVMNEGREMLGICNGVNVMAPGADGMVALSMNTAVAAWRI